MLQRSSAPHCHSYRNGALAAEADLLCFHHAIAEETIGKITESCNRTGGKEAMLWEHLGASRRAMTSGARIRSGTAR